MLQIHRFTFNPFHENTYLIYDKKGDCLVIDPGFYNKEEAQEFWNFLDKKQLQVKQILLTHTHLDHIFGLNELVEKTKIIPQLHPLEQEILNHSSTDALRFGFELLSYNGKINYLDSDVKLQFSENYIHVLHTPGHSPGSVTFYSPNQNWAIVGDVLFKGSIGRTDLRLSNYSDLIHSIKDKLLVLPEDTIIYPGHGPYTDIGYEKNNNPFLLN